MGSRSFTCLYPRAARHHRPLAGSHCAYPRRDGQAELTWVAGHIPTNVPHREMNPDTVTHLSTNRARRWLTSLIKANALTTTPDHHLCVRCTNYSAVVPDSSLSAAVKQIWRMSLLIWTLSANFWSSGTVMENTLKKDLVVAAIIGEWCPGVTTPTFWPVWRSKEVAVHLYMDPPLFTCMLTATAACYRKLLTRPISRCDCPVSNYWNQS